MKSFIIILIIVSFVLKPLVSVAQESLPDSLVTERISYIENLLTKSASTERLWWYGWLGIYSTATVAQGTVYLMSDDKNTKQDMALGAATTFIGAAGQIIIPLHSGKYAEILADMPQTTTAEKFQKLVQAEELLKSAAMAERSGRSWQIHALNTAVNLSSGLITWLGYKRSVWDGVGNFVLNSVVTEAQIWTQPTRLIKDYQRYCNKYKSNHTNTITQYNTDFYLSANPWKVSLTIVLR